LVNKILARTPTPVLDAGGGVKEKGGQDGNTKRAPGKEVRPVTVLWSVNFVIDGNEGGNQKNAGKIKNWPNAINNRHIN